MESTIYEQVGGQPFFDNLVGLFYATVETDPVLRPLYPTDLTDSRHWLTLFLAQLFGGPGEYSAAKGHPKLRIRHVHVRIGRAERDAWYEAMAGALDIALDSCRDSLAVADDVRGAMLDYFAKSADWMINSDE